MNIVQTWLLLGAMGAVMNSGSQWLAQRGKFGPQIQAYVEQHASQMEEVFGVPWLPLILTGISGFIFPPLPVIGLLNYWRLARSKQICTDRTHNYTFDEALARRAQFIEAGVPEDKAWVGTCPSGGHFHVFLTSDVREIAKRSPEAPCPGL